MKPKTWKEFEELYRDGDIEILIIEEQEDRTIKLLLCDHRRTYDEGEIYEIII